MGWKSENFEKKRNFRGVGKFKMCKKYKVLFFVQVNIVFTLQTHCLFNLRKSQINLCTVSVSVWN